MANGARTPPATLIDFSVKSGSRHFAYDGRWEAGPIYVSRCVFKPNRGTRLGACQFTVTLHNGATQTLEWRSHAGTPYQRRTIHEGDLYINSANRPLFMRWNDVLPVTVVALEESFLVDTLRREFGGIQLDLPPLIGINDPVIRRLVEVVDAQLDGRTTGGGSFAQSIATALLIHLFKTHGRDQFPKKAAGGLAPRRLKQVIDHIDGALTTNLEVSALAELVGLSVKHFAECFTKSMGISPHRYVTQRRIQKAKELLLNAKISTAEIAARAGFSSQSHFTASFRKFSGITPARFRRDKES